ncbi:hypothetical protein ILP97_14875 [Amycolatopsis sp. H6(2020)]|nr:hypothetical protein [Amycolatopsis sp. H6(2020)]
MAIAAAGAAVPAQAQAATNSTSSATVGCYASGVSLKAFPGTSGTNAYWPSRGLYTEVQGYCNDINVKVAATRDVRVCTRNKCHGWVTAKAGSWTVVFKNSTVGADYYLQFKGASTVNFVLAD